MENYGVTKYIQSTFEALSEKSMKLIDISDRDILEQMFSLPYPESFSVYFKRAIAKREPFCNVGAEELWDSDDVYEALGEIHKKSGGPESIGKYAERWRKYLTDEIKQPRRKQLLEFCIVLGLDEEETYKILAQFDGAGINYRNPEELLALYFILQKNEGYNLKHYNWMLKEYGARKEKYEKERTEGQLSGAGSYTIKAKSFIDKSRDREFGEFDEELLDFMVRNCDELTDSSAKNNENQYSVSQAENLLQMLRYIFVLMEFTPDGEEGYHPKVNGLMSYVNYEKRSWYADLIELVGEGAFHVEERRKGKETPQKVYDYLDGLRSHVYSIENRMEEKTNVDPVTRDDVLFFTLMLLVGFQSFGYAENKITARDLPKKNDRMDLDEFVTLKVDRLIADLYDDAGFMKWMENHSAINVKDRFHLAVKYVNKFLDLFGFFRVYPPNPMDRLVLTCLLSEEPWQTLCYICNPEYKRIW